MRKYTPVHMIALGAIDYYVGVRFTTYFMAHLDSNNFLQVDSL